MRAPLSWLREYVTVDAAVEAIADRLFTSAVQVDALLDIKSGDRLAVDHDRDRLGKQRRVQADERKKRE